MTLIQTKRTPKLLLLAAALVAAIGAIWAVSFNGGSTAEAANPPACTGTCNALINLATVSGAGGTSAEALAAVANGFTITEVSAATWSAMPASLAGPNNSFDDYQVLIIGDPTCGTLHPSVTGNAAVWAPVVMGTAGDSTLPGNRILIGTDPRFHLGQGGNEIIRDGIAFAGALPNRTGVYFTHSCADNGGGLATLNLLSVGSGAWTMNTAPPCGGSVSVIANVAPFIDTNTSNLQGWGCSVHISYPTFKSDWSALAVATDTPTAPTCGNDVESGAARCGEAYILVAGTGIIVTAPNITVTPPTATNPPGTSHTVTATVTTTAGAPVVGQLVTFTVTGQNNGASGTCVPASCMTDANGQVTFTYTDTVGCGNDTILASFTDSGTGSVQQASASKTWNCPTPTPSPSPTKSPTPAVTKSPTPTATPTPGLVPPECAGMVFDYVFIGTNSGETIVGTLSRDLIILNGGNDYARGQNGADCIVGGDGLDNLLGEAQDDVIVGGNGDDYLAGGWGNDKVYAGAGNDLLYGHQDTDLCDGGANTDTAMQCETTVNVP